MTPTVDAKSETQKTRRYATQCHSAGAKRRRNLLFSSLERKRGFLAPFGITIARSFLALCLCSFPIVLPQTARAQDLHKPSVNIDEDVTSFAFAPDGRVVYSVRRM